MNPTRDSRFPRSKHILGAAAIAIAAIATYSAVAVVNQPLAPGTYELVFPGGIPDSSVSSDDPPMSFVDYLPGATVTLNQSLANTGPVNVSITGVELSPRPPVGTGIFSITDARSAVPSPGQICCTALDEAATWSAGRFNPIQLPPGGEGAVALHVTINDCRFNYGGGYTRLDSIKIHYTVLGFPHTQDVALLQPVAFRVPLTCPPEQA